jgi:hypothetical protein
LDSTSSNIYDGAKNGTKTGSGEKPLIVLAVDNLSSLKNIIRSEA